jgi:hypothetical protein
LNPAPDNAIWIGSSNGASLNEFQHGPSSFFSTTLISVVAVVLSASASASETVTGEVLSDVISFFSFFSFLAFFAFFFSSTSTLLFSFLAFFRAFRATRSSSGARERLCF